MEPYDEQFLVDEAEDGLEQSQDLQDAQLDQMEGSLPQSIEQQSIYNWFWKVVKLKKPFHSIKVGNLHRKEIGETNISVRDALNLQLLGHKFHHPGFGDYFADIANITAASSMAKNGWFMDLSISQKKVRERSRETSSPSGDKKWKLFQKKNQPAEGASP